MTESRTRRVLAILLHDKGLKLLSLVAAIIFFSFVHGAEDAQKTIYVDVISLLPEPSSRRAGCATRSATPRAAGTRPRRSSRSPRRSRPLSS